MKYWPHWPPQHGLKAMTWFCTLCTGYGTSFLNWPHGNNLMIGSSVRTYAKTSCSSFAPVPLRLLFGLELARSVSVVSSFFYRFSFHTVWPKNETLIETITSPAELKLNLKDFKRNLLLLTWLGPKDEILPIWHIARGLFPPFFSATWHQYHHGQILPLLALAPLSQNLESIQVVVSTHLKNMLVELDHFFREGWNKKYQKIFETTT